MSLKVTFEISEQDLRHFREEMKRARNAVRIGDDADIIAGAQATMDEITRIDVPHFVKDRVEKLAAMVEMISDREWALPRKECTKVLSALAYFGDPDDLIPDHIPGLGFLDDAIMVELVFRELKHDIEAYRDFCTFRESFPQRFAYQDAAAKSRRLEKKRESLHARMLRRKQRDQESALAKDRHAPLW
ncbi:MAG: YkvA family protein [Gammaproteobacteria bacterium]|nr:YkvA family protein [Gammaproteobacteria bacterium]